MTEEEKRALLEGVRGEVFDRALGEAQRDREAAMLRRERDGAQAQLAALRSEVSEAFGLPTGIGPAPGEIARLVREHREMVVRCGEAADYMAADDKRIARLEAQLAALRMAADRIATIAVIPYSDKGNAASAAYNDAIRDTAAAAEAYTRRVRAEALREAADWADCEDRTMGSGEDQTAAWLRARADEIGR